MDEYYIYKQWHVEDGKSEQSFSRSEIVLFDVYVNIRFFVSHRGNSLNFPNSNEKCIKINAFDLKHYNLPEMTNVYGIKFHGPILSRKKRKHQQCYA